ncbi:MAG TPA: helix-turn-helix domain-containing protein [Caulobacteraceae bacterium]|jgi:AcrR family transcriptional regulator|nr:helix-turn-helix domain-containing protein [Caulobacteraceae bacterium]
MNQITMDSLGAATPVDPARTNQRALAKQRTREKILAAAKALFAERGYEGATIRDIAKAAGMSTGAVFASFTDKSDLFAEIAETVQADLHRALREAQEGLEGKPAVVAMLQTAAERQLGELALFQAVMSALWTPGLGTQLRRRLNRRPVVSLVATALKPVFACSETVTSADISLLAEMIWDAYVSILRRASLDGLTVDAVKGRIADQVSTILAGARRG